MRIQHNIMAMSAYRNYTNNVSAMKKNLEKLSSGYKINRAGDDAAGLAISEKMRAQITGLETAQKNAKDGISLVQTAEGALTEVHDMLNRMVELATMSANGTYDNTVDRAQLQKEMDQLNDEINRIADSANFNGIKLLDGSMDANGYVHGTGTPASTSAVKPITVPGVKANGVLGTDTILHTGAASGTKGTEFSVDLHDVKFDGKVGDTLTITLGSGASATAIKLTVKTAASSAGYNAGDIAKALSGGSNAGKFDITVNGDAFTPSATAEMTIGGGKFTLADGGNGRISFTQKGIPATASQEVLGGMKVTVASAPHIPAVGGAIAAPAVDNTTTGAAAATAVYTYDFAGISSVEAGDYKVNIGGQEVTINFTATEASTANTATKAAKAVADKVLAKLNDVANPVEFKDGITSTSKYVIAAGTGAKLTFTASAQGTIAASKAITGDISIAAADNRTTAHKGDYNTQTTDVKNVAYGGDQRLASTTFTLTKEMVVAGGKLIIGNGQYEFSAASADKNSTTKIYIGDLMKADGKTFDDTKLDEVARRLSNVAADNDIWTVGAVDGAKITLVEKTDANGNSVGNANAATLLNGNNATKGLDLSRKEGIEATLGYKGVDRPSDPGEAGKALTLQIGDTADEWNQLKVDIKDMHANMLGQDLIKDANGSMVLNPDNADAALTLATISIASQTDAAKAVDVIKRAINQVSDLRGTLGATQNRLDHTINNLSVMTENIQDAESTIRDVDVAEEMMAYTKNNILIQSAQAMLAQANQVPQGVLQLLQ